MRYKQIIPAILGTSVIVLQPLSVNALSSVEVGKIAEGITVLINYKDNPSNGSGVIIKKEGNTYTVLTAAHVVTKQNLKYEIVTPDDQRYPLKYSSVKKLPNQIDLAIVKFSSNRNYQVAKIGNSDKSERGTVAYLSGFPKTNRAINQSILTVTEGKIAAKSNQPLNEGYGLVYSNITKGGMSGGAVLNDKGELIGIHGRADSSYDEATDIFEKSGLNLGIPINSFVRLSQQVGVNTGIKLPLLVATAPKTEDFFVRGFNKYEQKNYKGAIADFTKAINRNPQYEKAYALRGLTYILLQDFPKALKDYNQVVKINPNSPVLYTSEFYATRGLARAKLKDYQGAIKDYNQSLKLNSNNAFAYSKRGSTRAILEDYQGAVSDFNQSLKLNPNSAATYLSRCMSRYQIKEYESSIDDCSQAIKLNYNRSQAYSFRGSSYIARGLNYHNKRLAIRDFKRAISDSSKAIILDDDYDLAYIVRANARFRLGDFDLAINDLKIAARLSRKQGEIEAYQRTLRMIKNIERQKNIELINNYQLPITND